MPTEELLSQARSPGAWRQAISLHDPECAPPTRLIEKVNHHVGDESDPIEKVCLLVLVRGRLERPVNEHGPPNQILARNESPVAAIVADVAVIAHGVVA